MQEAKRLSVINKMDLDSDETAIQQGFCRLARNVVRTRGKSGKGTAMSLTLGNKRAFNIGNVEAQNKRFRIYFPPLTGVTASQGISVVLQVKSPDGVTDGPTYNITYATSPQQMAAQITAQGGFATAYGNGTQGGGVTYQFGQYQYFDYRLEASVVTDSFTGNELGQLDIICVDECIPSNLAGRLIPIASADLDGKSLFIWSTSQRKRPTQIAQSVTGVTLNGPTTVITLSGQHDIQQFEHIRITHSASPWLNGTHAVMSVGPNTVTIATAQVFLGAAIPAFTFGQEKIYRHPYGICEVGVAQYDDNSDTWGYKRLIRSKEFNMNTLNTVDKPNVEKDNYKTSLYWTDGKDSPRALYVVGNEYTPNMCLRHIDAENIYYYGHINEATQHILPQAKSHVDFVEQKQEGGALLAGMKRYSVRLLNKYLVPTDWSTVSPPIPVFGPTTELDNGGNRTIGSIADEPTGKINVIKVNDVNRYVYDFIEIACINYSGGSAPNAKTLCRLSTGAKNIGVSFQEEVRYQHDGYEVQTDLALSDLIDLSSDIFDTAKSECALDGRAVFSNLTMAEEDDLTAWARTFKHRVMTKEMQESRDNGLTKLDDTDDNEAPLARPQVGEYQLPENVFRYVGYMDNETYRFGCMLRDRKTGKWTRVFHVDDISVDPYETNINGNPSQPNRRDTSTAFTEIWLPNQGGVGFTNYFSRPKKNWALTAPMNSTGTSSGLISAYTTLCKPMVSHIEFSGADMSATIGGVPIREKYDRIRFVRPDTVTKVLTTGYGVLGVSHPSMTQIMSVDFQQEMATQVGAGSAVSLDPIRSKIAIYGEELSDVVNGNLNDGIRGGRVIHEWPYFCGGMPVPDADFYSQAILNTPSPFTPTIPQAFGNPRISWYLEWAYPLNATVGQGFGYTNMRPDGTWDEHLIGDPLTGFGISNTHNFPNTRSAFVAFPNIISFYSPDQLFGGVDDNHIKEGRYRLRVMAVNEEAVRCKVDAPTDWGRAYNMMAEFHPRPSSTSYANGGGEMFQILKAKKVSHGSYTDVENFGYIGAWGPFVNQLTNPPTPKIIDKQYHRNLAGFNLKASVNPMPPAGDYDSVNNPSGHNSDTSYWQKITRGMWHNSTCLYIQLSEEEGKYPKFTSAFAHYGSNVGNANCQTLPPSPNETRFEFGAGAVFVPTDNWNGASLSDYNDKRTRPLRNTIISGNDGSIVEQQPAGTGVFYAQFARDIEDPYGDPEQTVYKWICAEFDIRPNDTVIPVNTYPVFGGDTFTQGTYIKNRYINEATRTLADDKDWDSGYASSYNNEGIGYAARQGFGSGFKMYSQNRINSQLRYTTEEQLIYLADTLRRGYWLEHTDAKKDNFTYSDAYTPLFNIQQYAPFIKSLPKRRDMPTRIQWSSRKVMDGLGDGYREVKPLSFRDLDPTKGEVIGHRNVNGELFSWQRDSFDRQFFNARGQLVSTAELNIVIGEADVMARDGVNMTIYGCTHRESIIHGKSDGGKDVVFWFNANTQQFVRFGMDGTVVISERQPIASWLRENSKWVRDEQSPHDTYGIRGVWDERYREAIWTFTGQRSVNTWQLQVNYPEGYPIAYGESGFNGFGDIYVAMRPHTSSIDNEIGVGADWQDFWEKVPHTDPNYYTEFTIAWNEIANGFSTFYGMMPSIYMKWRDAFLTPHPQVRNSIYVHRVGEEGVWWSEDNGVGLVEDGFQELIFNELPSEVKRYYAINVSSDNAPDRIEFETEHHESYLDAVEFEEFEGMWRSPIKEDSTQTGVNDGDTSMLFGRYLLSRFKIFARSGNTIREAVIKVAERLRSVRR